jgi:hypothetical protein
MAEYFCIKLKRVLENSFFPCLDLPRAGKLETIEQTAMSSGILILQFILWKRMQILNNALCFCNQSGGDAGILLT